MPKLEVVLHPVNLANLEAAIAQREKLPGLTVWQLKWIELMKDMRDKEVVRLTKVALGVEE